MLNRLLGTRHGAAVDGHYALGRFCRFHHVGDMSADSGKTVYPANLVIRKLDCNPISDLTAV
jgi:hypothetical protein